MRREIRDRPLEIDEIHNLLNDPYRRDLIQILQNDENLVVTFDELLTTLAEMRTNHSAESIETDEIALRLVHIHRDHRSHPEIPVADTPIPSLDPGFRNL